MAENKIEAYNALDPIDRKLLDLERRITKLEEQSVETMICDRCGQQKPLMQMSAVFDGGTSIICSECRKKAKKAD